MTSLAIAPDLRDPGRGELLRGDCRRGGQARLEPFGEERGDDPGEHVAAARGRQRRSAERDRRARLGRRGDRACPRPSAGRRSRSAPLRRRTASSRCAATQLDAWTPSSRASSPSCGVSTVGAEPLERLELVERVRVDDRR